MRRALLLIVVAALCDPRFAAQTNSPAPPQPAGAVKVTPPQQASPSRRAVSPGSAKTATPAAEKSTSQGTQSLEKVLDSMDRTAASFRSAQADFVWEQYESVVRETTTQKGTMYFRKTGNDIEMAADINQPPEQQKYVLFTGGKVRLYQHRIDQVTTYDAGKNREAFQSFLVLGFGGRGHDLFKQFDVKYAGTENVQSVDAAKLELTPKSPRVRGMFERIVLWIDPARGVSVQQEFFEPSSGNYRLVKYSNIKMNQKMPDSVFKLKTTDKTKFITPQ